MSGSGERLRRRATRAHPELEAELVRHAPTPAEAVVALQRAGGNQLVTRLLQRENGDGATATTPGKRKREEDEGDGPKQPDAKRARFVTGLRAGDWELVLVGADADVWKWAGSGGQNWMLSYWRQTGDYHVKGKSGNAAGYEKGWFTGAEREVTRKGKKNANADTIAHGRRLFQAALTDVVPLYV